MKPIAPTIRTLRESAGLTMQQLAERAGTRYCTMLEITGAELPSLPITDLEWVQDLDYFDGPLLSVFKHRKHGDRYLYRWCDCDENVNRWMILRVSETNIIRLANRIIPLDQVVPLGCQDDFIYFVDTDHSGQSRRTVLSTIESIPQKYLPLRGAFLSIDVVEQQAGGLPINSASA